MANRTHGMAHSPTHRSWFSLKQRCLNPNNIGYASYGGRGIKVCERWRESFAAFYEDMGERPSLAHSIERKNNDGDYEPGNCVWATDKEQTNNQRNNRRLTYEGETKTIAQWSEETGIKFATIQKRLLRGWTVEQTLSRPKWNRWR